MSRLSDRMNKAVENATDLMGKCDVSKVVAEVKPLLTDDEKDRYIERGITSDAKGYATRGKIEIKRRSSQQGEFPFPEIRRGYAIDGDDRYIKNTADMTEMEFKRVIKIREDQHVADGNHLDVLRAAYQAIKPIWEQHPKWTFGKCCEEMMRRADKGQAA